MGGVSFGFASYTSSRNVGFAGLHSKSAVAGLLLTEKVMVKVWGGASFCHTYPFGTDVAPLGSGMARAEPSNTEVAHWMFEDLRNTTVAQWPNGCRTFPRLVSKVTRAEPSKYNGGPINI